MSQDGGQKIRFCTSRDGVRLGFATCGTGPTVITAAHWITHLGLDWDNPVRRSCQQDREQPMNVVTDTSKLFEAERRVHHLVRPNFRITEMQISPTQEVPWHYHNHVQDTVYVVSGTIRIELRGPIE